MLLNQMPLGIIRLLKQENSSFKYLLEKEKNQHQQQKTQLQKHQVGVFNDPCVLSQLVDLTRSKFSFGEFFHLNLQTDANGLGTTEQRIFRSVIFQQQ